ncbi:hypothetical protein U5922_012385 [Aquicoccus sp. G2-2]|uniref:hypothetical protein n=1 Tax=Aquicoccus sp. G2-2 TaxID=3092120 RepID=UPI002ADF14B8|nr:hypothetical protein [Aquicoccus sp. G2-2]MEA1114215.1 hypothetical protein [Aquicoccus sp. G2-2]
MTILGKNTVSAGALGIAMTFASATMPLAEGRGDAVMGKAQVAEAMISTQSGPASAGSAATGSAGVGIILGVITLVLIAAAASGEGGAMPY